MSELITLLAKLRQNVNYIFGQPSNEKPAAPFLARRRPQVLQDLSNDL